LKSLFITGTDTDVGKTYITAGLAITLRKMGIDIGVMKPFAAGIAQKMDSNLKMLKFYLMRLKLMIQKPY
jgi:dethiobiotin synthase (EC 6.3.3.3)